MDTIVEAVAKAIETALVSGSASVGDERLREIARAAIEAYEAAKRVPLDDALGDWYKKP